MKEQETRDADKRRKSQFIASRFIQSKAIQKSFHPNDVFIIFDFDWNIFVNRRPILSSHILSSCTSRWWKQNRNICFAWHKQKRNNRTTATSNDTYECALFFAAQHCLGRPRSNQLEDEEREKKNGQNKKKKRRKLFIFQSLKRTR